MQFLVLLAQCFGGFYLRFQGCDAALHPLGLTRGLRGGCGAVRQGTLHAGAQVFRQRVQQISPLGFGGQALSHKVGLGLVELLNQSVKQVTSQVGVGLCLVVGRIIVIFVFGEGRRGCRGRVCAGCVLYRSHCGCRCADPGLGRVGREGGIILFFLLIAVVP